MHGESRVGRDLDGPGLIAKTRVVVALLAVARDENKREALDHLRGEALMARRDIGGEGGGGRLFHDRGGELDLSPRGWKPPRGPRVGRAGFVADTPKVLHGVARGAPAGGG